MTTWSYYKKIVAIVQAVAFLAGWLALAAARPSWTPAVVLFASIQVGAFFAAVWASERKTNPRFYASKMASTLLN